ncbi:MAG: phospho-N-acetylmuramoyl-pentapeptide-transferase [Janthinobacterium lividum]
MTRLDPYALAGFLVAFLLAVVLGPRTIEFLRLLKFGQNINEHVPGHQQKQGTPTMGGLLFVLSLLLTLGIGLAVVPSLRPVSPQLIAIVLVFIAHAGLGFLDDFLKARRGKSLGLLARQKLAGQVVIALLFVGWLYLTSQPNFTTQVWFWHQAHFDFGYAYYALAFFLMIGMSNAANLTDGLDGLAGGLSIFTLLGLALTTHPNFAQLPLFGFALAGACLGFLWYNAHPAKVFMGDTGSLALGSSFAAMALIGKQEVLLLLFGIVFLIETFSVMIQVGVFKATGGKPNGRRVFKMTPIHHHFELSGWKETQVVARFWIIGILALVLGLLLAPQMYVWL